MNIYLAARYSRREEICRHADDLRALGHVVNARWLLGEHQIHAGALAVEAATEDVPDEGRLFAEDDVQDVMAADMVVTFTEPPRSANSRGGRHVEFGLAIGLGKQLAIVGPRENVFHCLPQVRRYPDWSTFLSSVKKALT